MNTPIITLHNIKHYDMKKTYNVHIHEAEKVLITGKNGIGKTTILQMIAGFIKPKTGKVVVHSSRLGYLHSMKYLPLHMTVYEFLDHVYQVFKESVDPLLWMILYIDLNKPISDLSKGQKQKLLLMFCFIGNPDIVLLDEPFTALDPKTVEKLILYMKQYQHAIIMTSHTHLSLPFMRHIVL